MFNFSANHLLLLSRMEYAPVPSCHERLRLHPALGYRTPEEFEQATAVAGGPGGMPGAATMTFFSPQKPEIASKGVSDLQYHQALEVH